METRPQQVQRITRFEKRRNTGVPRTKAVPWLSVRATPISSRMILPMTDKSYMDGRWVLNFGSYNYAGMSGRQEVSDAAIDAIRRYGTSASGSRLLAGEKSLDPGTGARPSRLEACGGCAGAGGGTLHKRHLCGKLLPRR